MSDRANIQMPRNTRVGLSRPMDTELGANNDVLVFGHGPRRVLITVALHGNEPCGVDAVNQVIRLEFVHELVCREFGLQPDPEYLKEYIFSQLTIIFLLGNPNAYLENKRYMSGVAINANFE